MKKWHLLSLLIFLVWSNARAAGPFDEARNSDMARDQRRVRMLYLKAAQSDPDPRRRDQARIHGARIDWYMLHDPVAARASLAAVGEGSTESSAAFAERSRLETELVHDFNAARKAADLALAAAKKPADHEEALTRSAAATVEESLLRREAGKCPESAPLHEAIGKLREAIKGSGPTVERSHLLLDAALLSHDDAAALQAWRWIYADLPELVPPSIGDRRAAGLALASARLFAEADLILRDPCSDAAPAGDAAVRDVLAYAAAVRRVGALAAEHHRSVAAGTSDNKAFSRALRETGASLWKQLSWPGPAPAFSPEALQAEVSKRFGTVMTLGETEGIFNLLYGHRVADETRVVEQYGHKGSLHFIQLDGMISGGYSTWATHGESGTGGWSEGNVIYQIRSMYVDGPLNLWRRIAEPAQRATADEELARESALDRERARGDAIVALRGLNLRLVREYGDQLRASLAAKGLEGDALRDEFIRKATTDKLESSIWAHEGRHSIDKALGITTSVDLEFRAKLSEVAFAPAPRGSLGSILSPVGGSGAHAVANERALRGVVGWMRAHSASIAGLDPAAPIYTQLDLLTDDQLREAFRSLDPLAR